MFPTKPPNYKELEEKFPLLPESVINDRMERLIQTMTSYGYKINEIADDAIFFDKKVDGVQHFSAIFGLWQIKHEPDEDFELALERIKESEEKKR